MKSNAYLKDENLLTLLSLNNFIVPEIQREYVWGNDTNKGAILQPFLQSIKDSAQIEKCGHAHSKENIHIGFLYSYAPIYLKNDTEYLFDECLIDGQQRFTTLFLLLLSRAVYENRIQDFLNLIRWEEGNIAFDYKVRNLTHMFLFDLICAIEKNGIQTIDDIVNDRFPNWLMRDYQDDVTVKSMLGALKVISKVFDSTTEFYFDFLLSRIRFWHFKTDVTSQGEELYITMNSRGEELSGNETSKAQLLSSVNQIEWGPKWETWQTFFWKHRCDFGAKNENADKGFNNFLACCNELIRKLNLPSAKIEDVSYFFDALDYVMSNDWNSVLRNNYLQAYCDWIEAFKEMIWKDLNSPNEKWVIEDTSNDTTQLKKAAIFWPWLYYFYYCKKNNKNTDNDSFIRILHLCYMNGNAGDRGVAGIKSFVEELANYNPVQGKLSMHCLHSFSDVDHYLSEENKQISQIYYGCSNIADACELESIIWKIQNEKYILDATYMDGITIQKYLPKLQALTSLTKSLKQLLNDFLKNIQVLFPKDNPELNAIVLKRCLLFYNINGSAFWKQESPYYYRNYETSIWKRIIRSDSFIEFYFDMIKTSLSGLFTLQDVNNKIVQRQDDFFRNNPNHRIFNQGPWKDYEIAILYDFLKKGDLWRADRHSDLGFKEQNGGLLPGWPAVMNKICKKRNTPQLVDVPKTWKQDLQNKFMTETFVF